MPAAEHASLESAAGPVQGRAGRTRILTRNKEEQGERVNRRWLYLVASGLVLIAALGLADVGPWPALLRFAANLLGVLGG